MKLKSLLFLALFLCAACGSDSPADEPVVPEEPNTPTEPTEPTEPTKPTDPTDPTPPADDDRFVGGDLSMLTQYESQHAQYTDKNGKTIPNLLSFVKEQGWNTIRVRLFVDPSKDSDKGVCQNLDYVVALGKRIKQAGLRFMLDFHYSDTWADPGKQWTPDAWKALSDAELQAKIYDYTRDCLQQMNSAGATPDFIQTGNEISYGMLWGTKAAVGNSQTNRCYTNSPQANWDRFFLLLQQATKACRELCPQAKLIIHSERVPNAGVLTDFFDRIKAASIDYDVIGLSYYPYFHGKLPQLETSHLPLQQRRTAAVHRRPHRPAEEIPPGERHQLVVRRGQRQGLHRKPQLRVVQRQPLRQRDGPRPRCPLRACHLQIAPPCLRCNIATYK